MKRTPCRFYRGRGGCRNGDRCRFSHEETTELSKTADKPGQSRVAAASSPQYVKRRDWSFTLKSANSHRPHGVSTLTQGALDILDSSDHEAKQSLIKELGEKGLDWVRWMVEQEYHDNPNGLTLDRHCVPFLSVISHQELLSSLILEKSVGTIYNIVYGPGGQRATMFFTHVGNLIAQRALEEGGTPEAAGTLWQAILPTLRALLNTISLNQEANVQKQFKEIATSLNDTIKRLPVADSFTSTSARRDMQKINERLHIGSSIPRMGLERPMTTQFPAFELRVDLPGELSELGPRHSNDHASIEKILILPTADEIKSKRNEFLPLKNPNSTHHEQGIHRLLDSQFRLLREDTTGPLRDAIGMLIDQWDVIVEGTNKTTKKSSLRKFEVKISLFGGVRIERLRFDRRKGVIIDASFNQPEKLLKKTKKERKEWWTKDSKDLSWGSLVALVDDNMETTFMLVADRDAEKPSWHIPNPNDSNGQNVPKGDVHDLYSSPDRAMISLQLVDATAVDDQARIVRLAQQSSIGNTVLVEFPGTLFASFGPILKGLKSLHKNPNIPFTRWLVPNLEVPYETENGLVQLPPPLYITRRGITIDLSCITAGGYPLSHSVENPVTVPQLQEHTSLDHGQAESLVLSLQSELALIQGPPGTGKSYLGEQVAKVLLANRRKLNIGPIICVCYTNHALDQFLEHILLSEPNVIRLGSRSKSPSLQERTLAVVQKGMMQTRNEKTNLWNCFQKLDELEEDMEELLLRISQPRDWYEVAEYLEKNEPDAFLSLFGEAKEVLQKQMVDEYGFQRARGPGKAKAALFKAWIAGKPGPGTRSWRRPLTSTDRLLPQLLEVCDDVWSFSHRERLRVNLHWKTQIGERQLFELQESVVELAETQETLDAQYNEVKKRCLEQAHVIGVTTTGLAQNSELLRGLNAKVLIIEEAAEVLEAHTITALLPSVEHTILIGDHLQLRPQIARYELSMESEQGKKYGLDESLFERLTRQTFGGAKLPIATLDVQRRMHPSISSLIRNTLYPTLNDHPDTASHPGVPGMRRRLFWLNHSHHEDSSTDDHLQTSKTNEWEANMTVSLVRHLSRQGIYRRDEIAVLTPYLGQLRKLRQKFSRMFDLIIGDKDVKELELEGYEDGEDDDVAAAQTVKQGNMMENLRLATVDNFQGEEAKVIVISLVRSNPERRCGFLKTFNRINVLLSRARDGMYIIGDAETSSKVKMWSDVVRMLEDEANLSRKLELKCPRHPTDRIFVSEPEDFVEFSPEGGCSNQCGKRLNCGHTCVMKCHSDPLHNSVKCYQECTRTWPDCEHVCPKLCWQDCGNCRVKVTQNITLPCGHTPKSMECHETKNLSTVKCQEKVVRSLGCGHQATVACHTDMETYRCKETCGSPLECGHMCARKCSDCRTKSMDRSLTDFAPQLGRDIGKVDIITNHKTCIVPCGRSFSTCNHACRQACHRDEACKPCDLPCDVRCSHSKCNKLCHEPCPPCAESCTWACPHRGKCNMPCAVPCDMAPCNKRCELELPCGHQCPGVCGEACPTVDYCQQCASPEILQRQVDIIMFSNYDEADLDDDPMIFPSCGHFYSLSTMDGHMDLKQFYVVDDAGEIVSPRQASGTTMKNCPECRCPLRNIHRYNRVVKTALLDESTKRFMALAAKNLAELQEEITAWEVEFETEATEFLERIKDQKMKSKTAGLMKYKTTTAKKLKQMNQFLTAINQDEQPYGRVYQIATTLNRRQEATGKFDFNDTVIQHGHFLRGSSLQLRVLWAMLWNYKKMLDAVPDALGAQERHEYLLPAIARAKEACAKLRMVSAEKMYSKEEIEARIYHAQFVALDFSQRVEPEPEAQLSLKVEMDSLEYCSGLLKPSTKMLEEDIEKAKRLLNGGTFYSFVSSEEKRAVYAVMAREFSGTGHWYYCVNGHPFTVGECGMPMELARCPECDEPVGGQSHQPTAGVQRAEDLERQFARLGV